MVCLSGNLSHHRKVLEADILARGGCVAASVTLAVTHLVSTPAEFEALSSKVMGAITRGVPVVTEAWLDACEVEGELADESRYLVQDVPRGAAGGGGGGGSPTRPKKAAASAGTPSPTRKPVVESSCIALDWYRATHGTPGGGGGGGGGSLSPARAEPASAPSGRALAGLTFCVSG